MSHSHAEQTNLTCSDCNHTFTAAVWLIVDAVERPDLLTHIQAGTLHNLPCPQCRQENEPDVPLLLYRPDTAPCLVFSPAQETSPEEDQEQAGRLLALLAQSVGDTWQDGWLEQMPTIPRPLLPIILSDDPESALVELRQAVTQAAEDDPEVMRQLAAAAQQAIGNAMPLLLTIQQFIATDTWIASFHFAQAHPELLEDEADTLLTNLAEAAQASGDTNAHTLFNEHLALLRRAQAIGLTVAFAEKLEITPETLDAPTTAIEPERGQALADSLAAWMQQETLDDAETYLQQHAADLLTDDALVVMQLLIQANPNNPTVADHQNRLARARELGIAAMYADIRQQQRQEIVQKALQQAGPIGQAVFQFIQVEDDATAVALLQTQANLLLTWDAGELLRQLIEAVPDNETLQTRYRQWQAARAGGSGTAVTQDKTAQIQTQLLDSQSGPRYEIDVAMFTAIGDNAVTLNVLNFGAVTLRWQRPQMGGPGLLDHAVGRRDELEVLHRQMHGTGSSQQHNVAIVGKGRGAIQGMPGVGKSTLAALYAESVMARQDDAAEDFYPGGVLWLPLGPTYTTPESVLPALSRLAALAYSDNEQRLQLDLPLAATPQTIDQIQNSLQSAIFTVEAVQKLLSGHGRILVIADDIWERQILPTIRQALPINAHLLVTTRDDRVARAVGQTLPLDVLSREDALILIREKLGAMPQAAAERLIQVVGAHPMALQIALGDLNPADPPPEWAAAVEKIAYKLAQGLGVDPTTLDDIEPEKRLSGLIAVSYQALAAYGPLQHCFRALGSLAPEAPFATPAAAALCGLAETEIRDALKLLRDRSLLRRLDDVYWQQHTLLRSYALEQQTPTERLAWGEHHAAYYLAAMRLANDSQSYYTLVPDLPNLRHAFAWAIGEGRALGLAQDLLSNCANLLQSQNLGREYLAWAEQVRALAAQIGGRRDQGAAALSWGNALQNAATLVYGPDRAARLQEALAAYDEALEKRRDVPLDYATTQNNRANLLRDLATLPGQDRAARLQEALTAYDEALEKRRDVPLDYATTQNNRAVLLSDLATLPGQDRAARLQDALAAYDEALEKLRDVPLAYATTQNNRAVLLRDLATLPGQDRAARLQEALAAYDEALEKRRDVPLDYATTQNNRANLLSDLATLPGQDRAARLQEALAAYDEALEKRRDVPLDYAITQNNRANLLSDLATLPGQDRAARLQEALAAYDEALEKLRDVPLAYATTQNNRAVLLSDLATLPGQDRAARLQEALTAYDEALEKRRDVPLDYAQTQNNRAILLRDLATLPGQDRAARLQEALAAYDEALEKRRDVPLDYATTQNNRANLLSDLATLPGQDRAARLQEALAAYDEALEKRRDVPLAYAQTQNNRAILLSDLATLPGEDRAARLQKALADIVSALRIFAQVQQMQYLQVGRQTLAGLIVAMGVPEFYAGWTAVTDQPVPSLPLNMLLSTLAQQTDITSQAMLLDRMQSDPILKQRVDELVAFAETSPAGSDSASTAQDPPTLALAALLQVNSLESLQAALAQHPALLELPTLAQLAALVANAQEAGQPDMARHLLARLIILIEQYHQAHTEQVDPDEQAQFVALMAALLSLAAELDGDAAAGLRHLLGWALNTLGNQYATQGDHATAVESYTQALVYAPDNAMLYRNRAGEYLELRQFAIAAADVERAAALEPDAPRLADLLQAIYSEDTDSTNVNPNN